MARKPIRGIGKSRRMLRRLPDEVRGELVVELHTTGRQMNQAVLAKAPRKTGALRARLSYKVLPVSLRLQVGLIGTPSERRDLFYGRIQDLGRKAQIARVSARPGRRAYTMKVSYMEGKRFVTGRYPELRQTLRQNLNGIFTRCLSIAAGGSNE